MIMNIEEMKSGVYCVDSKNPNISLQENEKVIFKLNLNTSKKHSWETEVIICNSGYINPMRISNLECGINILAMTDHYCVFEDEYSIINIISCDDGYYFDFKDYE